MEEYLQIPIKCLLLVGHNINLTEPSRWRKIIQIAGILIVASAFPPLLYYIFFNLTEIPLVTESLTVTFTNVLSIVKIVTFLVTKSKFASLIKVTQSMLYRDDLNARNKLKRANHVANLLVRSYFVSTACTGFSFMLLPALKFSHSKLTNANYTREIPMKMKFPFDSSASPMYELVSLYIGVVTYIVVVYLPAIDGMFISFTFNLSAHFKILQESIETHEFSGDDTESKFYLNNLIMYHNKLLNISEEICEAYWPIISAQFFITSLQLCVIIYQFQTNLGNTLNMMLFGMFLFAVMIQLFLYCYGGEIVKMESNNMGRSVYLSNWYQLSLQDQRSIAFILQRTRKQVVMKAVFYEASFGSFMTILKAAMSYTALLQTI